MPLEKIVGRVTVEEVKAKGLVRLEYPPFDVLVAYAEGQIYAIEDSCNHAGASLASGWVDARCVVCPMHGYVFDLANGKLLRPRGLCNDQRTFKVRIEGDDVVVVDDFHLVVR